MQNVGALKVGSGSFIATQLHDFQGGSTLSYYLLNYSAPTAEPCDAVFYSCLRFMTMDLLN